MARNSIQHTLTQRGINIGNPAIALLLPALFIMLVFAGIYLSQIATYASTNREIESLIAVRNRLEQNNERLRAEIAELETIPRLLVRAEEQGFFPAEAADIEYLLIDGYNPNRALSVVSLDEDDEFEDIPVYDETFSGWIQQQLDSLTRQFDSFGR